MRRKKILFQLLDFLISHRYVELVHWAEDVYAELGENLDSTQRTILELLKNRQIKPLVSFLEKQKYKSIQEIYLRLGIPRKKFAL